MRARVSIKLNQDYPDVRLVVSQSESLTNPVYSSSYSTQNTIAKITISGLAPDTQYYYGVMVSGTLQAQGRGKFKTYPSGASSFTCAFGSCAPNGSNHEVFDTIRNQDPLFFIHMGDIHYADITTNNVSLFRNAYDTVFEQSRQANLYANVPTLYMWDDHDFSNNDSWGESSAKPAAQQAYKERVPHLPLNANDGGIGQSWVVGRVRFIMPDLMSYKTNPWDADSDEKTQFGEEQIQWFFDELLNPEPLKIWVNTKPWIGDSDSEETDKWWGYATERMRIANFIKDNNLQGRVAIISGDMHGIAIDNGTNSDYATGGGAPIPVFQASPLGSDGSIKGGGWSHGSFVNGTAGNQYGVMNITDNGTSDDIVMEWLGKRGTQTLVTYTLNIPSAPYNPSGGSDSVLASDSFNRADTTTLVNTACETGQLWSAFKEYDWGIQNNQVYPNPVDSNDPLYIEANQSDNLAFEIRVVDSTGYQFMWRIVDGDNYHCIDVDGVWVRIAGNWTERGDGVLPITNGDLVRVEMVGDTHSIYINGTLQLTYTDANFQTATKFGFSAMDTNVRYDDFSVKSIGGGVITDTTAPIITSSSSGGAFINSETVMLVSSEPCTIYYTLDGSSPTTSSLVYSNGITIDSTATLRFFGVDGSGNSSAIKTLSFTKEEGAGYPLDGLVTHYDLVDSEVLYGSDNRIQSVSDLSGNGLNAVVNSVSPLYDTTSYAHPVMDFNPTAISSSGGVWLRVDNFTNRLVDGFTIVATAALDNTAELQNLLSFMTGYSDVTRSLTIDGAFSEMKMKGDTTEPSLSLSAEYNGGMAIFTATSSTTNAIFINGVEKQRLATGSNGSLAAIDTIRIGKTAPAPNPVSNFDGKMGDVLIYDRELSSSELATLHNILKSKWSIS